MHKQLNLMKLCIEGYLEQAEEALQLAEEAMHAVFEADSLLS